MYLVGTEYCDYLVLTKSGVRTCTYLSPYDVSDRVLTMSVIESLRCQ
jgi:hypothetical protein